jgi:DNA-binding CsgD family transcriptional regulator
VTRAFGKETEQFLVPPSSRSGTFPSSPQGPPSSRGADSGGYDFVRASAEQIRAVIRATRAHWLLQLTRARRALGGWNGEAEGFVHAAGHFSEMCRLPPRIPGFVYMAEDLGLSPPELVPDGSRSFQSSGEVHRARLLLIDRRGPFGLLTFERPAGAEPFSAAERRKLEELAPFVVGGARAEVDAADARCELSVILALGPGDGTDLLANPDTRSILWGSKHGRPLHWAAIESHESGILSIVERWLVSTERDEVLPTPPRLAIGDVLGVSVIRHQPSLGSRCVAVRLRGTGARANPIHALSVRERAVVRLLIKGYEPANIAAIMVLGEPTIRTYIRRAYKKLDVCNRADLIRKLLTYQD